MSTTPILSIRDIHKSFKSDGRSLQILQGISFDVEPGSWTMLIGQSGSGKSTLLQLIASLDQPDSGQIIHNGTKDICRPGIFGASQFRRKSVGLVFQSFNLVSELNALENVMLPGLFASSNRRKIKARATELLTRFGMADRLTHHPNALSGGEQQRIAIARALINDPEMILADEPTGNLDPKTSEQVIEIFTQLRDEMGKTIIMVTHDMALRRHADKTLKLDSGVLV